MSPDEPKTSESQEATEVEVAAEAGDAAEGAVKKDRLGFLGKAGDSMGRIPLMNRVPRSMRLIVAILFLVILIGIIAIAWPSGEEASEPPKKLDISKLEDFSWSSETIEATLTEYSSISYDLEEMMGDNGTVFIERIEVNLQWTDEDDVRWGGRMRINHPDHFAVEINATANASFQVSSTSEFVANDQNSKQGSLSHSLDMGSHNFSYVMVGNLSTDKKLPDDLLIGSVTVVVHMDEAEDYYADGPAAFKLNDFGNLFTMTVSVTGKTMPDDSGSSPPEE